MKDKTKNMDDGENKTQIYGILEKLKVHVSVKTWI